MKKGRSVPQEEITFVIRHCANRIQQGSVTILHVESLCSEDADLMSYLEKKYPNRTQKNIFQRFRDILRGYAKNKDKKEDGRGCTSITLTLFC